jgi:hypothetical protein
LSAIVPRASGSNDLKCYRLGDGPFAPGLLADGLELVLKPGSTDSGNIVPTMAVTVLQLEWDLAQTRNRWVVDES